MKIHQITQILEAWAPLHYAEDFDNVGLLVGSQIMGSTGYSSPRLFGRSGWWGHREKLQSHCLFSSYSVQGTEKVYGKLSCSESCSTIKNDVAIYAIHTALDNQAHGVSFGLSQSLGLTNTSVLLPKENTLMKLNFYVPKHKQSEFEMPYFLLVLESWVIMMSVVFLRLGRKFSSITKQYALCR